MQISTNTFYDQSTSLMQQLTQQADRLNTQISTNKRLQSASDDVVAYQRLATIGRDTADDAAASANVGLAQSLLQQSDSTLGSVETALQQASELVVQANSGTLDDSQRQTIATQLQAVIDQIVTLANTRDARGEPLFGAATGDSAVTRNADGSVSFTGTGEPAAIPIGDAGTIQATDSAARVFGGVVTSSGATSDVFSVLTNIVSSLKAGNGVPAGASDDVTAALGQVTSAHGSIGVRAARLDLEADRLKTAATGREADRSALEDTDVTASITELQKITTVLQATQASFAKLSQLSLFDEIH